jgi:Probable zinc-ribbon domain
MNETELESTILICKDCGNEFEFKGKDKLFFQDSGWPEPKRCKICRIKNREKRESFKNKKQF